jgi:hypothetical protein
LVIKGQKLLVVCIVLSMIFVPLVSAAASASSTSATFYVFTKVNGNYTNGIGISWKYAGGMGTGLSKIVIINDDLLPLHYSGSGGCTFTVPKDSAPINVSAVYMGATAYKIITAYGDSNVVNIEFEYTPPPKEKEFYVFTKVNGAYTNTIAITCRSSVGTSSTLTHDMNINDAGITHSGPGACLFTLTDPTGPVTFEAYRNGQTVSKVLDSYADVNALTFDITETVSTPTANPTTMASITPTPTVTATPTPLPNTTGLKYDLTLIPINTFVDNFPPITTLTLSGTMGQHSWYVSPVLVTLNAMDADPGVDKTLYQIYSRGYEYTDGWRTYEGPFTLRNGEYLLYYYSVDKAGNKELINGPVQINTDSVAPAPTIKGVTDGQKFRVNESVSATVDVGIWYPGASGQSALWIDKQRTTIAGGEPEITFYGHLDTRRPGAYTLSVDVTDMAGNTGSRSVVYTVVADGNSTSAATASPVPSPTPVSGSGDIVSWFIGLVIDIIKIIPGLSGTVVTPSSSPAAAVSALPTPTATQSAGGTSAVIELPAPGVYVINLTLDGHNRTIIKPTDSWVVTKPTADNTTIKPPGSLRNDGSGVKLEGTGLPQWVEKVVLVNDANTTPGKSPISGPQDDSMEQWLLDNGFITKAAPTPTPNPTTTEKIDSVMEDLGLPAYVEYDHGETSYDKDPPRTWSVTNDVRSVTGWYQTPVKVRLMAEDTQSGVKDTWYSIEGDIPCRTSGFVRYTGELTITDGVYKLFYYSIDNAGNMEQVHGPLTIQVDTLPPEIIFDYPVNGTMVSRGSEAYLKYRVIAELPNKQFTQSYRGWDNVDQYVVEPRYYLGNTRDVLYTLKSGVNAIHVLATDNAGNYADAYVTFTVD